MTYVTASPRTGCARGIASTSVRSYLRSTESEDWVGKEEAAAEPSDALPADDREVVLVGARVLHSGAGPMPDTSDTKVDLDEDTKNEDPGAFRLSAGPQTRSVAPAVPSPGVFIGARNSSMGFCSNKLIGN
jgi:hypothetical protein